MRRGATNTLQQRLCRGISPLFRPRSTFGLYFKDSIKQRQARVKNKRAKKVGIGRRNDGTRKGVFVSKCGFDGNKACNVGQNGVILN